MQLVEGVLDPFNGVLGEQIGLVQEEDQEHKTSAVVLIGVEVVLLTELQLSKLQEDKLEQELDLELFLELIDNLSVIVLFLPHLLTGCVLETSVLLRKE